MLASTVQFSTTNPRHPPHDPTEPRPTSGDVRSGRPGTETTTPPPPAAAGTRTGPLPQDPTACLRPRTSSRPRSPPAPPPPGERREPY
jgi:hypothetical protein